MGSFPRGLGEVEGVVVLGLGPESCSCRCRVLGLDQGAAFVLMECSSGHGGMGRSPLPRG